MLKIKRCEFMCVLAMLWALSASIALGQEQAAGAWKLSDEEWFEVELADARAGWMHTQVFDNGEQYRTDTETQMKIARGAVPLEIVMKSSFTETHAGKPLRMTSHQDLSVQTVEYEWVFGDEEVLQVSKQGGRTITKKLPWPEGHWLTPMGVQKYVGEQIEAGAMEIKYSMVTGEQGITPVNVTMKYVSDDLYPVDENRFISVTVWNSTTNVMPLAAKEMYDQDHKSVYSEIDAPFGRMVTKRSTREKALGIKEEVAAAGGGAGKGGVEMGRGGGDAGGAGEAGAGKPDGEAVPELMVETFVKVARPIKNPHETTSAMLRLRAKKGTLPELPSAGAQRATTDAETGDVFLTVDINDNLPASGEDEKNPEYLEATTMVDSSDTFLRKLADHAVRKAGDDPMKKAEALRAFVHKHISKKGLATAFASASETARTRTGDCSEHGVLLAAMLRAEDIPSRVAVGLVYAQSFAGQDDIFGWHMWTQALIDGKWVDFDATLPVRYSAAHVLTGTTSLADGLGSQELSSLLLLLGNLEIEVEDVGYDAPKVEGDRLPDGGPVRHDGGS